MCSASASASASDLSCIHPRAASQLEEDGITASAAHCYVTSKAEVDALVDRTVEQYGTPDLLVANAGIVNGADFVNMTEEDFDDVIRVNFEGDFPGE